MPMWRHAPVKRRRALSGDAVARPGHRGPAEIQGSSIARAQRLDAVRIEKFPQRLDGRDRRADFAARRLAQALRHPGNDLGGHHRFVALQIDHNIVGCESFGAHRLGNSIGARDMIRRCHHAIGAELQRNGANALIVRRHEYRGGAAVDRALPYPLNQRPIADLQQRLCRQPSRSKARRYDDVKQVKLAAGRNTRTGS